MGGRYRTLPGWPDPEAFLDAVASAATPVAWCVCVLSDGFVTCFDPLDFDPCVRMWGVTVGRLPDT